jgi:hypothetical protein
VIARIPFMRLFALCSAFSLARISMRLDAEREFAGGDRKNGKQFV